MSDYELWAQGCGLRDRLKAFRCYEQLEGVDDKNDLWSWAHGSKSYE